METSKKTDAGKSGSTYYDTNMQPSNWYTWFTKDGAKDDDGWTQVCTCIANVIIIIVVVVTSKVEILQEKKYESSHSTFSQVSAETSVSYGGLFYSGSASGGYSKSSSNSSLTSKGSKLKIAFKVRKVIIQRSWLDPAILQYSSLGIRQLEVGKWSNGSLKPDNKGCFPVLPTACIVAKDVVISAASFSDSFEKSMTQSSTHASAKVIFRKCIMKYCTLKELKLISSLALCI